MSSDAEAALARAWIYAQDDLDDPDRIDSVRVAADRLQGEGQPLGELVTLGLALLESSDANTRASLRTAYTQHVTELLPEALGPFASLLTYPHAFDMRWSLCYLAQARLPLAKAHLYAGLFGVERLDPAGMLAMFLAQPGARCLRSLTLDLGRDEDAYPAVLELLARRTPPIETLIVHTSAVELQGPPSELLAMPYLHTFVRAGEAQSLPGGDPTVAWAGDSRSIRALGRAATSHDPARREQALARIRKMERNSIRYLAAIRASEPSEARRARVDPRELLVYAREAASLERQREQLEAHGVQPRWRLRARWRELVPNGGWFATDPLDKLLRAHNQLHDSPRLEVLPLSAMRDDPDWIEFRRQAAAIVERLES